MGESNALMVKRGTPLRRDTALAAAAAYQHLYCEGMEDEDATDNIAATYQVGSAALSLRAPFALGCPKPQSSHVHDVELLLP
jgi:hypothetical protein